MFPGKKVYFFPKLFVHQTAEWVKYYLFILVENRL